MYADTVSGWSTPNTRSRIRVALCWLLKARGKSPSMYSMRAMCLEGEGEGPVSTWIEWA